MENPLINLLKYADKNIAIMIMKKLPPKDLLALCEVKNKKVRELCQNFLYRGDYQRIWGGYAYPKRDIKKQLTNPPDEKYEDLLEPNLEILFTNIKSQPKDIQKKILLKLNPDIFALLCKNLNVCSDEFIEKYAKQNNIYYHLLSYATEDNYDAFRSTYSLFKNYLDINTWGNQLLYEVCSRGGLKILDLLIEDRRISKELALKTASKSGNMKTVDHLITKLKYSKHDIEEAIKANIYGYSKVDEMLKEHL